MSKDPTKAVTHSEEQGNWPAESSSKKEPAAEREPCVKYFDALWFCYCEPLAQGACADLI